MKLYHWTLNAEKIQKTGFHDRTSRHTGEKEGVWFTDQLLGPLEGIKEGMKLIRVEIPLDDVEQYEKQNEGTGYRAFSIPANVINKYELQIPVVYRDRGIFKTNG